MSAKLIDGKSFAAGLRARAAKAVEELKAKHGITPGIAVVLVGDDPASAVYVASKTKAVYEAGFAAFDRRYPATLSQSSLIDTLKELNAHSSVHGILVQMPLPEHIEPSRIIDAIDPVKDVDGLHPTNAGRLMMAEPGTAHGLVPCTPLGALMLLKDTLGETLAGKEALVVGRSNLVGKPMAQLLLQENCTVTMAHSKSTDLEALCRRADILVAAVGRAEMIRGSWIKPGATVIDVGMNRKALEGGKTKLVGDVNFAEAAEVAGAITPVPGGVGPMTIACLIRNTVLAAYLQAGLPLPAL
jgi:methylenetetrahydrofolate dehydrogenase (NADP+)/methenyltetrahydrofolate cyclohydrolase